MILAIKKNDEWDRKSPKTQARPLKTERERYPCELFRYELTSQEESSSLLFVLSRTNVTKEGRGDTVKGEQQLRVHKKREMIKESGV